MRELEYPFDADWILKKKKSIKKELLRSDNGTFMEKRIAILSQGEQRNTMLLQFGQYEKYGRKRSK